MINLLGGGFFLSLEILCQQVASLVRRLQVVIIYRGLSIAFIKKTGAGGPSSVNITFSIETPKSTKVCIGSLDIVVENYLMKRFALSFTFQ